ncbi:FAD-binding oxidoreductase (plasmid) [Streptomyces sp. AHU1]|uniref:FAD-binding oxidoreductase n=1 Tax=Streptomyces sp. AHU1 TaxID=3377215 RepID=UPI0038781277
MRLSDWAAFASDLDGPLIRPGDALYKKARQSFQPRYDVARPAAVAYVSSPQDVATCLAFVRRFQLSVTVRSGGHSYAGWSTSSGLVIDVSNLDRVVPGPKSASVGSGVRLIDLYAQLSQQGVTVPAGSCPTVGVAGLVLGGGIGVTSRAYGATSDNLMSAQVVTADGRIRTVDAHNDSDLFWALRGGGGGNFAVATRFDFRTHVAPDVSYAFLSWPWSRAAGVLRAWQAWAPVAHDSVWSSLHIQSDATEGPRVGVTIVDLESSLSAQNAIERLTASVGASPGSALVHTRPYLEAMQVMAGTQGWTVAQSHLPGRLPGRRADGRVTRESYGARSDFYTRALSDLAIDALLASVERYIRSVPAGGSCAIALDALGGAINRVGPAATAFVHRNGLFLAQYMANWPEGVASEPHQAWLNDTWASMRRYASGQAYQNYIDPQLTGWAQAYYGRNLPRLEKIKSTYDPDRIFDFPQAVPNA